MNRCSADPQDSGKSKQARETVKKPAQKSERRFHSTLAVVRSFRCSTKGLDSRRADNAPGSSFRPATVGRQQGQSRCLRKQFPVHECAESDHREDPVVGLPRSVGDRGPAAPDCLTRLGSAGTPTRHRLLRIWDGVCYRPETRYRKDRTSVR